jgi:hypothetical protein
LVFLVFELLLMGSQYSILFYHPFYYYSFE